MQYNSAISQSFMVMSFAAAGLLLSVQLVGDRSSPPSQQVSSPISIESVDSVPTRKVQPNPGVSEAAVPNAVVANIVSEAAWRPSLNSWSWIVQPIRYPIKIINAQWAEVVHESTPQNHRTIDKIKGEMQAMPAFPSPPNTVSQVVPQARIDSTSSSPLTQHVTSNAQTDNIQTSHIQTSQIEHTLAERFEEDEQDRRSFPAPPLAVASPQPSSLSSVQHSTQVNSTTQDLKKQAITTDDQTDQNNIQQEHPTARLVVDLSDRQLAFYQQDGEVQTYSIAVGKAGWETPLGEFTVTDKDPSPLWQHPLTGELVPAGSNSPLGSRWIGFWSDGIHQIGFHGTNQAQSIGQAISHGCIRLYDEDIQVLYSQVALGTPVIVQP